VTRVKITTPVEDHNGAVGNVLITQGVGYADTETHAAELVYCRANGYTITEIEAPEVVSLRHTREDLGFTAEQIAEMEAEDKDDQDADGDKPPRRNGSAEAWRAYAIEHGLSAEEAEALTRDQLVERFTSTEEIA
jgi:hypothetical protein